MFAGHEGSTNRSFEYRQRRTKKDQGMRKSRK